MDTQTFLRDIQSDNADSRFAAWRVAGTVDPSVIPQLGTLAAHSNPGLAKAAREALTTMVHAVGKEANAPGRSAIIKGLLSINAASYATPVRVHALRLLSNIAGEDAVPAIARDLANAALREEAIYCLERIPGRASDDAIIAAYRPAPDEFKPRLLAALGHRRAPSAVALCTEAMRSPNKDIAIAAAKAFGRIGQGPATAFPSDTGLGPWQQLDRIDSMLRDADAQVKNGNAAAALPIYKAALERPEEHWRCAAIVGISKIGTAEAAALIMPHLKSTVRNVRITAQQAWKAMA